MRAVRKAVAGVIVGCALAAGDGASASNASSSLAVSVRVVRSCAVQAQPLDGAFASVRLRCSSGHESSILISDGQLAAPRAVVHVAETDGRRSGSSVRTVTLNF